MVQADILAVVVLASAQIYPCLDRVAHAWRPRGLDALWNHTTGDPEIRVAILDGPVDASLSCFRNTRLTALQSLLPASAAHGPAARHGTAVASILFDIAPNISGLLIPVFSDGPDGAIQPCSQLDLARAIQTALHNGAHVINISGGQLEGAARPLDLLVQAVELSAAAGALVIASAGNDGCDCLNVPASLRSVLTVGAMDVAGNPLPSSNWGSEYRAKGILAPGQNIPAAQPGGAAAAVTGTSFATAITSGVAALLLSMQLQLGRKPDGAAVRAALLNGADRCEDTQDSDCRRVLAGRLNLDRALSLIIQGGLTMTNSVTAEEEAARGIAPNIDAGVAPPEPSSIRPAGVASPVEPAAGDTVSVAPPDPEPKTSLGSGVQPAACGCGGGAAPQLVYALGQIGYDFGTEARRDSILQQMGAGANPYDVSEFLGYIEKNPWEAASVYWTLNLDATPVYAVVPDGSFASKTYERLVEFLQDQAKGEIERVSIPGKISGSVRLFTGQMAPVIHPEIRGMYSWTTSALVDAAAGPGAPKKPKADAAGDGAGDAVRSFLERVYHELRNLGTAPQERALNFAATNAFSVHQIFQSALNGQLSLDTIEVEGSPICRPESDCWDVKLTFFNPAKIFEQARKVYRFTVDVSDIVPVTVGPVRSWFVR